MTTTEFKPLQRPFKVFAQALMPGAIVAMGLGLSDGAMAAVLTQATAESQLIFTTNISPAIPEAGSTPDFVGNASVSSLTALASPPDPLAPFIDSNANVFFGPSVPDDPSVFPTPLDPDDPFFDLGERNPFVTNSAVGVSQTNAEESESAADAGSGLIIPPDLFASVSFSDDSGAPPGFGGGSSDDEFDATLLPLSNSEAQSFFDLTGSNQFGVSSKATATAEVVGDSASAVGEGGLTAFFDVEANETFSLTIDPNSLSFLANVENFEAEADTQLLLNVFDANSDALLFSFLRIASDELIATDPGGGSGGGGGAGGGGGGAGGGGGSGGSGTGIDPEDAPLIFSQTFDAATTLEITANSVSIARVEALGMPASPQSVPEPAAMLGLFFSSGSLVLLKKKSRESA